ncbi:MAG TPA: UDP-N-acetylmuramoyl-L-alanine--D-glutamate ligase [Euzebyales bacterium]|nr:UDP-N-acetylmuramoyl-L-alanine--D-glutamate ligase [Euzebyales bacterium]
MSGAVGGIRILVAGLGVSGIAAARAAVAGGADVMACDAAPAAEARARAALGDAVALVADPAAVLRDATPDVVVASPGLAPTTPVLVAAAASGVPIWSEPELAWRLLDGRTRVLAVTGTNGKTTTTELLAGCLGVPAAGNIGQPLSTLVDDPPPLVVAELSSFQLHFTHTMRADVGVVLNVADDHLDWHGDRAAYAAAKARIWRGQRATGAAGLRGSDWAVSNLEDGGAARLLAEHPPPAAHAGFTLDAPPPDAVGVIDGALVERLTGDQPTPVLTLDALGVRGRHNVANATAVVAAAIAAGAPPGGLAHPLSAARVGAHRLETVAEHDGVRWVNDSKATNPHAAAAALRSFDSVIWIAGGLAKGVSFAPLAADLGTRVRLVLTIGQAGPAIAELARGQAVATLEVGTLDAAVAIARERARQGDVVLLAPACASMDQFVNYAARGDRFRELVADSVALSPTSRRGA